MSGMVIISIIICGTVSLISSLGCNSMRRIVVLLLSLLTRGHIIIITLSGIHSFMHPFSVLWVMRRHSIVVRRLALLVVRRLSSVIPVSAFIAHLVSSLGIVVRFIGRLR